MSQQKSIEKPEVGASQSSPVGGTATGLLPGAHWAQLVEESGQDESDNGLALGDNNSSTTSLASTILEYRMLNGRRYHSERGNAQYWVSNDEQSNAALDINHHVMTLMYGGKLYKAPLKKDIQTAVDIGTGTGIWAIDFADEFPNTKVIGTDISAIQPSWIPPNLEFQIDDCTQEWTLQENSLDFVHMRFLVGSVVDWPALYKQAYRCLKPGGLIESHEASPSIGSDDGSVVPTSAMGQWGQIFFEGGRRLKRPFSILEDKLQTEGMKEAGFVNMEEEEIKVPIGGWPTDLKLKQAGKYFQAAILQDIEGTLMFIADLLGWSKAEVDVFGEHYSREIKSNKIHGYFLQKVVWAQKPETT
ncbi:hypothetical protein CDV36_006899 [Fusarium kuroshium]|uniref:Methyltransferase domain-containing protein n=1 Tax=Fusarium kuroshium TaxID=2010991 RepID=A0A3M2S885_9HYPO|nr:hypothetical protein CDV36_006899 [Fusarium kuroshium]